MFVIVFCDPILDYLNVDPLLRADAKRYFLLYSMGYAAFCVNIFWSRTLQALGITSFSLYVSVWAVVISLWAAFGAIVGSGFGGIVGGIIFICRGDVYAGLAVIGAGLVLLGLSVLLFYGCMAAVKGTVFLTKKLLLGIKRCFTGKEAAQ